MNPSEICVGQRYMVKIAVHLSPTPVEVVSVVLIKFPKRGQCPQSYICTDLTDYETLTVPCSNLFLRLASALDCGAHQCSHPVRINDGGFWDHRKCILCSDHPGRCLTSLHLYPVPEDAEYVGFLESLFEDDPEEDHKVIIPRANWPKFEL
jgi:hypothetical protein